MFSVHQLTRVLASHTPLKVVVAGVRGRTLPEEAASGRSGRRAVGRSPCCGCSLLVCVARVEIGHMRAAPREPLEEVCEDRRNHIAWQSLYAAVVVRVVGWRVDGVIRTAGPRLVQLDQARHG